MSKPRELSKLFTSNTNITTDEELFSTVNSASAYALSEANDYTDNELSSIDLTSTINTASAAAFASASAYTDSQVSSIDLSSTIQTASAAAVNFLVDGAPEALNTLNELAAALEDNADILDLYLTQSSASTLYSTKDSIVTIDSNYTAVEDDVIFVNTASTAITVTLPASPSSGSKIKVLDVSANSQNNNITILGNTYNINSASAYVINTPDSSVDLVYVSSNKGWIVSNEYISLTKPQVPLGVTAVDVGTGRAFNDGAATVSFTPSLDGDLATSFTVTSTPGSYTATGSSSPIVVPGLQSDTSYTFKVYASNAAGNSTESTASSSITATTVPQAPTITSISYGFEKLSVNYTAGATGGKAVSTFIATRTGAVTASGTSPIAFSSLTGGTTYEITMTATNANGTSAPSAPQSQTPFTATGGTITTSGIYRIHTFTGSSNLIVTGNTINNTDYLVIAGGGGGGGGPGSDGGGGGGAGGVRSTVANTGQNGTLESKLNVAPNTYSVTVGAAGAGGSPGTPQATNGNDSIFSTITSIGGGGGDRVTQTGNNGGSGGAGNGLGTAGQGNNGGATRGGGQGGNCGGGAGGTGSSNGPGISNSISGSSIAYGGGGGGGNGENSPANGGVGARSGVALDGGGAGGGGAGTANRGGGGGGAVNDGEGSGVGASGGSGIVIIRYEV